MKSNIKDPENNYKNLKNLFGYTHIEVFGAKEHNLKNIDVSFPRDKLVVITGISGSGKSSLAFDTIYAEGQRRYMESFATYARNFIGNITRPDVDKITGLSPVIAIEQKTTGRNPRSTVGTTTEIYDFLRLLFSKIAEAFSYNSGKLMVKQTEQEILNHIKKRFNQEMITLLSPIIKSRKGHYKELLNTLQNQGFSKVRIDGEVIELEKNMQLDRYKTHNIELVIDRVIISESDLERLQSSLQLAFSKGKGTLIVQDKLTNLHYFSKNLMDPESGISYDEPAPNSFSFNSPSGACPNCGGLGIEFVVNEEALIPNQNLSIKEGGILPLGEHKNNWTFAIIDRILKNEEFSLNTLIKDLPEEILNTILRGSKEEITIEYRDEIWNTKFSGIINQLKKKVLNKDEYGEINQYVIKQTCSSCNGRRLKKESLFFRVDGKNISELSEMDLDQLNSWFENIENRLTEKQNIIAKEPLKEIRKRLHLIMEIGLNYLHLNRPLRTLSGGEAQRIRLATQIGTQLIGVLYILDEPSIGLHQRDNEKLIKALKDLRDQGNSILVVEHDKEMMLESDYILDIGPGAGKHGGRVVAQGNPKEFLQQESETALFLSGKKSIEIPKNRRKGNGEFITINNCEGHNLKNVDLKIPLGKLICITGVSGSGKSSLIHGTLYKIINRNLYRTNKVPLKFESFSGIENIDKIVEVDQSAIGRTPRSNPMTYTGVFTLIRSLFTNLPEAKIRGYKPGRFSFNVKGGRCETCEGAGIKLLEMDFLPNIRIHCETCRGKRYNRQTLEVKYKGKSISDILEMTVDQSVSFFDKYPKILRIVKTLQDVGLGYITLGQHATTLSGGEAQRVKLATELAKRDTGKTLYILDEPTTGLHFQDIVHLISIINKLVDKGNTVLIIEHNMDIIKVADHIIDIGPEGGHEGGYIVAEGTPEEIVNTKKGYTVKFLKEELDL